MTYRLLLPLVAVLAGCFPARVPLRTTLYPGSDPDTLVLLMPGLGAHDRAFGDKGIVSAAREAGVKADLLAVDATLGYYLRDQLKTRLGEDVIGPLSGRYEHVWVLGISMGGLGALLTAKDFAHEVDGVVLLSPYLGRKRTLEAVRSGQRMSDYSPPNIRAWDEDLWDWLKRLDGDAERLPPIYLGYGTTDLGMQNHTWLSGYLPAERVRVAEGGHAWPTWRQLTTDLVRGPLSVEPAFGASVPQGIPALVAPPAPEPAPVEAEPVEAEPAPVEPEPLPVVP